MLRSEDRASLEAQRKAFRDYMKGSHALPLVLERSEGYTVEAVISPTAFARVRLIVRYIVLSLASISPFCPVKIALYRLLGVKIGRGVCISPGVVIDPLFPELIELEDHACLGIGCRLFTHEYTVTSFRIGRIRVGKRSVIGTYATVRSGVAIGARVTVGASSFVNRDVTDGEVVGGVPARPLGSSRRSN
jgi:acetyltransferase-like isoleucine patch superfamily enzyme